ncbi:phage tail fiber [Vibrio phage vB_VchM_VP-3213]|nr:phage tail fiber [Vibrio phage vB_VchM_VP-3213]
MSIPESALNYGSILTLAGENAEINGKLNSKPINFTHIAIGDANDVYVQPSRTQTALVHELARIPITGMEKITPSKPDAVPQLKVWAKIPDNIVDIAVREFAAVATFDGTSYLHAVGNTVRIPILSGSNNGGEVNDIYIEMTFAVTSLDPIVMIDPTIVTATRKFVKDEDAKHLAAANPHPQYMRFGDEASYFASIPIGMELAFDTPPPTNDSRFRFVKLTADDAYNGSLLTNKVVSGTAPNLVVKMTVNSALSNINGQQIEMLNTMGAIPTPGLTSGVIIQDAIRNITASVSLSDLSLPNTMRAFSYHSGAFFTLGQIEGEAAVASKLIGSSVYPSQYPDLRFDASRQVPTADRVQVFSITRPLYRRIY